MIKRRFWRGRIGDWDGRLFGGCFFDLGEEGWGGRESWVFSHWGTGKREAGYVGPFFERKGGRAGLIFFLFFRRGRIGTTDLFYALVF